MASPMVILPQKSIFDLRVNSVQPLLCSIGPISVGVDFSLQFCDPLFGGSQLLRKLLSHFQRVSAVVFGNASNFMEQLQDRLSRLVELVGIVSNAFRIRLKSDHGIRLVAGSVQLSTHSWTLPPDRTKNGAGYVSALRRKQPFFVSIAFSLNLWRLGNIYGVLHGSPGATSPPCLERKFSDLHCEGDGS